ncbi:MAG: hypothetical protein AB7J32_01050 [Pseudonocardia sp.]
MREKVESVLDHAEALDERTGVLRMAEALARDAVREVRFGMFAESSAGKSLLVGALVGNPLLLPVDLRTVTCTITELRLQPVEVEVARITAASAEYLRNDEVAEYIGRLLAETGRHVHSAGGDADALRGLPADWAGLHRLGELLADPGALRLGGNARADLLDEVRAMLSARTAMDSLGIVPGAVEELERDGTVDRDAFADLVDHGATGPAAGRQAMVRRVVVDVEVPVDLWGRGLLHGAGVRLVDVPGTRSGRRPVRDGYLRDREIDAVDTALVFLDSTPGSVSESRELEDRLRRRADAVLVVAGRFDRTHEVPGVLLDDPRVAAEEAAVLERSPELRMLVAAARALLPPGGDERVFFVSPYATMALADELELGWSARDTAATLRAGQGVATARDRIEGWRKVGRIPGALGAALAAFTVDGGLDRLRRGMARHAADVGVDQALRRLLEQAEDLRLAVERLERLRAELGEVHQGDDDARRLFERVLGTIAGRVVETRKTLAQRLADPEAAPRGGESPAERVRREAERVVYDWPEWKLLFDAVIDGRVVAEAPADLPEEWRDLLDAQHVPVDVAEFRAPYREACRMIAEASSRIVEQRVEAHLRECGLVTPDERQLLQAVLTEPVRGELANVRVGPALLLAVERVTRPEVTAATACAAAENPPEAPEDGRRFPLDPARALAWHPDSPRRDRESYTGLGQLLRLRCEMADAVTDERLQLLAGQLAAAATALARQLQAVNGALTKAQQNSAELVALVGRVRSAASTAGDEEGSR